MVTSDMNLHAPDRFDPVARTGAFRATISPPRHRASPDLTDGASLDSSLHGLHPTPMKLVASAARSLLAALALVHITLPLRSLGADGNPTPDFIHDVAPVLSRFGCNGSACHGKAEGQNGFKLSVFGNDPRADFEALVLQDRGRRVMQASPENSLLLTKSTAQIPHAGGPRLRAASKEYEILRCWVAEGTLYEDKGRPEWTDLRIEPPGALLGFAKHQPLRVLARSSVGREEDVTWLAIFHSNNAALADVDEYGTVTTGSLVGQAAIMARFEGRIAIHQVTVPQPGPKNAFEDPPGSTAIDRLVHKNLRLMNLLPSGRVDDAGFLRRVSIDLLGRIPTVEEARAFIADTSPDKRMKVVDKLLNRSEYADLWALKWSDVLRVDRRTLGHANAFAYYRWIHGAMEANTPLDVFARELLEAEGPLTENSAGFFFKVTKKSGEMAATASQALLGIRITCAECHQHPYDRWTQSDYHGMRAYFEQVRFKKAGTEEALIVDGAPKITHPRTKEVLYAHPLGSPMPEADPPGDRRAALSRWLAAPENPWFARNMANRIWAHFLGRGLVEPVDDVRASNPPSNPELLTLLAKILTDAKFDQKVLIREIVASEAYQRSATPNHTNGGDELNFSRALFRRLPAEVLLDAICDVTGIPEKFGGVALGQRAVQLWDSEQQSYFLKLFGRPTRATACVCERSASSGISQSLHFMNSNALQAKLSHADGNLPRWLAASGGVSSFVDSAYLACFSRHPSQSERDEALAYLAARRGREREAAEDLVWSLFNSLEFVFNH
jgi:hypothetical protein